MDRISLTAKTDVLPIEVEGEEINLAFNPLDDDNIDLIVDTIEHFVELEEEEETLPQKMEQLKGKAYCEALKEHRKKGKQLRCMSNEIMQKIFPEWDEVTRGRGLKLTIEQYFTLFQKIIDIANKNKVADAVAKQIATER